MIRQVAIMAAAGALAACWGAPPNEKILTDLCTDLFEGEARTTRIILENSGTDLAGYCGCFAAQTVAGESQIDKRKEILVALLNARQDGDSDIEDAADRIEEMIDSGEIEGFTSAEFDALGDYFQDLTMDMGDAEGTCPS